MIWPSSMLRRQFGKYRSHMISRLVPVWRVASIGEFGDTPRFHPFIVPVTDSLRRPIRSSLRIAVETGERHARLVTRSQIMNRVALALLLCLGIPAVGTPADPDAGPANPAIDMKGYLQISQEAAQHRSTRRLSVEEF